MSFVSPSLTQDVDRWLSEDGLGQCESYWNKLPATPVKAVLKIKSPLILAGLPWFIAVFERLDSSLDLSPLKVWEGKHFSGGEEIELAGTMPWSVAVTGERLALNLLHRGSAVATSTSKLVEKTAPHGIKVLDIRKTTPGLRSLEKYAVTLGGGHNHRFTQVDTWMIKDNHKALMGLEGAIKFFNDMAQPYKNLVVEIHSLEELKRARALGVRYYLLDNFGPEDLRAACAGKVPGEFFEISGGIRPDTVDAFLMKGVDAVSSGSITMFPSAVDISFKYQAVKA